MVVVKRQAVTLTVPAFSLTTTISVYVHCAVSTLVFMSCCSYYALNIIASRAIHSYEVS